MNLKMITVILLAGLLLFGCAQNSPQTAPAKTSAGGAQAPAAPSVAATQAGSPPQPPATPGKTDTAKIQEIALTSKQFEFSPSTITVKKGVPVKITITTDDVTHGFSLPDFNVNADINPGTPAVVQFTPDKAGTFSFACSVVCGAGHGSMKGTLVVEG